MLKKIREKDLFSKIILCLTFISLILIILNAIKVYRYKVRISTYNIVILGDNPMTVYQEDEYIETGFIAYNYQNKEKNELVKITNNVNTNVIGKYEVVYEINNFFKKNKVVREVNVIENPLKYVKFILKGDSVINIDRNTKYQELGFNVISDKGDFTKNVSIVNNVDTNKVGMYDVIYTLKIGNKEKTIKRMVNVVGDKYTINLDNKEWTNHDVKIMIENNLKDFDYFINPNNIKVTDEYFEFVVDKNDTYTFHIVDKRGIDEIINVNVTNIDKEAPIGVCNGLISGNKTTYQIKVSDDSGIEKYNHDNVDYTIDSFVINKIQEESSVKVYDKAGNIADIACISDYEYLGPTTDNYKYKYESSTLKYWIENAGTNYKTTHIWVKDSYNQMKVAIPSKIGSLYTAKTIINGEIKNKGYEEKGMVAINASAIVGGGFGSEFLNLKPSWVGTAEIPLVLNDGKIIRDSTNQETPNVPYLTYGIKKNGYLDYYRFGKGKEIEYNTKIKERIISDGIKYTYGFSPVLVWNNEIKSTRQDKNIRQAICQIDRNNFIIVTNTNSTNNREAGFSLKSLADYMKKQKCKYGFNLDGGGSVNLYYKGNNKNIYNVKTSTRGLVDVLYFVEK